MDKKRYFGDLMLFLAAFIWGTAFVAQVTGMDRIGPFTFNMARSVIAIICLGAYLIITKAKLPENLGLLLQGGLVCGLFIFLGTSLQQIGLQYTTAGKTGFITSFYILIIPFLSVIFLKHKIDLLTWGSIILGFIGLYLLAIPNLNEFTINKGDFIVFIGSFLWAGHILIIDYYSKKINPVELSFLQFVVLTILSGICAFIFENETATMSNIMFSWKSIAYAGFLSSGIAYTLQMVGQKYTNPVIASLILSLEAVFAALAGYFMLDEIMTSREFLGCCIVFLAIISSQIPKDIFKKKYIGIKK
ncbi:DMT family transporter [Fusobacterium simiae]|uniref:DMT family transporter n=1 Tax=Fusobacterium simiae TaxID=855 RepID=A0ABT4DII1_FUSSI|nr:MULTISPECIES: DMT family transporter [Fusobacterium]MCY7008407.1 DMT family transporter [Fusobacterium simiae]MDC7956034.1 DMT family transporter [Fusobacterium simiae]